MLIAEPAKAPSPTARDAARASHAMPASSSLALGTKLAYGFGSVAFGVKDSGFSTFLLVFYSQGIGLRADLVGLAIMIALIIDGIVDPLIGRVSDHTRSRLGRRHPYMFAAALPCAITFYLLWNPPSGLTQSALFVYLLTVAVLVRISVALYEIPSASLAAELTTDYDQRTSLVAYRFFFGWVGGIGMTILALSLFLRTKGSGGLLSRTGYSHYGLTAAVVMMTAILISAAGTSSVIASLARPATARPRGLAQNLREMRVAFSNRSFLTVLCSGLLVAMVAGLVASLNVYFAAYFWGLSSGQISLLALCGLAAATLALVLAPVVARSFEKRSSAILISLVALILAPSSIGLRLLGWFPSNGSAWLMPMLLTMSTVTTTLQVMAGIVGTSMMLDSIEDNEIRTGQRTEGLYFAAAFFTQKFVSGFGVLAAGMLLRFVRFPAHAKPGEVDPAVLRHLALVYLPAVVVVYALSILCLAGYRISRAGHARNLEALRLRHARK